MVHRELLTPIVDGLLGPSQARPPSLAPHPPVTCAGTPPIEREPQKTKVAGPFPPLLRGGGTQKGNHRFLAGVRGNPKAPQPFLKYRPHPPCIILTLKADN